jgi:hypothetical protein
MNLQRQSSECGGWLKVLVDWRTIEICE